MTGQSRVFLTGDTHGELDVKRLGTKGFPEGKNLTKDDFVVVLGDFGLVWDTKRYTVKQHRVGRRSNLWEQSPSRTEYEVTERTDCGPDTPSEVEQYWLEWLAKKPFSVAFCGGNHENWARLLEYQKEDFHGGKACKVWDSVWFLPNGEVFDFGGRKFLVFGGAVSVDKEYRQENVSWWPEEVPSKQDVANAWKNLDKHNRTVDFVLSHTAPSSVRHLLPVVEGMGKGFDVVGGMLDEFYHGVRFKDWFFGHYHFNYDLDKRVHCLHSEIREV